MKKFTSLDNFVLESVRKTLVSKGYDLTVLQIYEYIKKVSELESKYNKTQNSLFHLWTMYNIDPPKPPYNYCFESQDEAMNFAQKAKSKYNVNCEIDLVDFRKWRLTTKKKKLVK